MTTSAPARAGSHRGLGVGGWTLLAAIVVVALNLRPAIVAVGPLTGAIRADVELSAAAASLLTTLPLLCLGAFAAVASPLAHRVGFERGVAAALVLIAVGIALRVATPLPALFVGSALAGCGIAVANVLTPAIIKRDLANRLGVAMAVYSVALQGGATVASGVTVPLGRWLGADWRLSLAIWGLPAVLAVLVWLPYVRRRRDDTTAADGGTYRVWRSPLGWASAGFIGIQSGVYFSVTAWLPSVLRDNGFSDDRAGFMLSLVGIFGIVGGLPMPLLAARMRSQRILVAVTVAAFLLGLVSLLAAPAPLAVASAVLLGLGQGGGLSLALTLFTVRSRTADGAAQLSGVAQTAGYLIAAVAPLIVGVARDLTGGWSVPLALLTAALVPLAMTGWTIARPRYIEDEAGSRHRQRVFDTSGDSSEGGRP